MKRKAKRNRSMIEAIEPRLLFTTLYVDANAPGGTQNGNSWTTAYLTLQQALAVASGATHDQILVADGAYTHDVNSTFQLISGVELHGGYAGASDPTASRNIAAYVATLDSVTTNGTNNTALLDGFNLAQGIKAIFGNAAITNCSFIGIVSESEGAGIYCNNSSPLISGCLFSENLVNDAYGGGGIYNYQSSPTIVGCVFVRNHGGHAGGAICNIQSSPIITDCTFDSNYSAMGAQVHNEESSNATFARCTFSNTSPQYSTARYAGIVSYGSSVFLEDCVFSGINNGGAMGSIGSSGTLLRCTFTGNNRAIGSFHSSLNLWNCNFENNTADHGGAITSEDSSSLNLTGCTFTSNRAGDPDWAGSAGQGGAIYVDSGDLSIANCTFNDNQAIGVNSNSALGGAICSYAHEVVITGCIFTNNSATTLPSTFESHGKGGAFYQEQSATAQFINCTFSNNSAYRGGGIYNSSHGDVTLAGCTFSGNSATSGGAGLYNINLSTAAISNSMFIANSSPTGGSAISDSGATSTITDSVFSMNIGRAILLGSSATATRCSFIKNSGGGASTSGTSVIADCTFVGNTATSGGAVVLSGGTIKNSTFLGNAAVGGALPRGGALVMSGSIAKVFNCIFVGNTAANGAAVAISFNAKTAFTNCTFASNSASASGGAIYSTGATSSVTLNNCILWENTDSTGATAIVITGGTVAVNYTDIQGGWTGTGNIDIDPQFIRNPSKGLDNAWGTTDDDYGDLRLRATSSCVDAGDNASVPVTITTDLLGNPRIIDTPTVRDPGAIVDMGAYEYQSPLAGSGGMYLHTASRPTVKVGFNGDVNLSTIQPGELVLLNQTTGQTIDTTNLATLSYDANTRSATWKFNTTLLADGNYHATLAGGSVNDTLGNPLGSTYEFDFFVLGGDANHDGIVNTTDLLTTAQNWQGNSKVFSQGDFNYDTKVDLTDLQILAGNWGKTPSGAVLGPLIPMPTVIPLSPPPPPPATVVTLSTTANKRTPPRVVTQVL